MGAEHTIVVRDPRARSVEPRVLVATCSCGWSGPIRTGRNAQSMARTDGVHHIERTEEHTPPPQGDHWSVG
jgi:hypothetical protein